MDSVLLTGNGQGNGPRADRAPGAAGVLSLKNVHGAVPGASHVSLRDLRGALGVVREHRGDERPVLSPGRRPGVEPEDVDPGQQTHAIVDLIERVSDQRVATP